MNAEDYPIGTMLTWEQAPRVKAPADAPLLYIAPGTRGMIVEVTNGGVARVQFQFKNSTGGMSFSPPIEVERGQPCDKVIP